ncbi:MAG TPA: roadblock/LC7 domain-containing protein [Candidatus Binatia bacterium]|nr:roadblock/LC7 domain-containing protein [Candidatus Binatia bacterium]
MFGAIKKIFKRGGSGSQESSARTQAVAEQESYSNEAPAAEAADYSAAQGDASGESLRVSLKALVPHLPKELQGKNPPRSDEALVLPKHQVLEQLAQGAVKVPFGQLRRIASVGVLAGGSSHDNRMVDVPLKEIIAQLRGEAFPRRTDQRVIQIPDEIQDIFGNKGEARAHMRVMQKEELKPAGRSEQAAPQPEQPTPIPVYQTPTAASFTGAAAPQQARIPISSAPTAAPASGARPMQPIQRGEFLAFNLSDISANWPDPVKREIQRLGVQNSKCLLPTSEIQEALKQGRVGYTWGQISVRLQPALATHAQVQNGQTVLELPIAAVASAFFTQTPSANVNSNRPVVTAPTNIEPLFRGGPAAPPQQQQRQAPPPQPPPIQPSAQLRMQQDRPLSPQQPISPPAMPQGAAPVASPPARPAMGPSKGNVTFKVSDVTSGWPEELKKEVNKLRIASSKVAIPFEWVEPGLRTGKIEFTWAEFCGFVEGCPQQMQSAIAANRVSLPLPVLAPLCLRLSPPTQRKAATYDEIPDIFGPGGTPAAAAPPAAPPPRPPAPKVEDEDEEEEEDAPIFQKAPSRTAPAPASARAPSAPPPHPTYTPQPPPTPAHGHAPAHATADAGAHAKNLAELFGEPGKRNWTPNEIVQRTAQLPGVAGALIALQDGLLVANCMPQGWKTETIAAFLPQIFGRMSQYVKELSMGDLISVTVAVEQGTLQVYKAGIIYFAALARPDMNLPFAALNLIARELSRHTK